MAVHIRQRHSFNGMNRNEGCERIHVDGEGGKKVKFNTRQLIDSFVLPDAA